MRILISALCVVLVLSSFMTSSLFTTFSERPTLNEEAVVVTEALDKNEISKISSLMGDVEILSAKILTESSGQTFLEIATSVNGEVKTLTTEGYEANMVPPCHCGPGQDGIYNAWWEGLTPYRYKKPYCLPCLKPVDTADS